MQFSDMLRVTAAIIVNDGKFLLAQRKIGGTLELKWEFPGGKIEDNETPEECLRRELFEEFKVIATIGSFLDSVVYHYEKFVIQLLAYEVKLLSDISVLNSHEKIEWVELTKLGTYDLAPADKKLLELIKNKLTTCIRT